MSGTDLGLAFSDGPPPVVHDPVLAEDRSVYAQDDLRQLPEVKLTVTDLAGLAAVDADKPGARVAVLFQEGSFGAGLPRDNGTLQQRGSTSRLAAQKSYKIRLESKVVLWRGQREINLLKNPFDLTRARNHVAFELLKSIPHTTSLRHQFVKVTLNGQSLGLYEWFEEVDARFLAAHGLDRAGTIYKASRFAFNVLAPDSFENPDADPYLEPKAGGDPARLAAMIAAVTDEKQDIDAVIDQHFQRDNYESWLALQILLGNWDSVNRNYYLYNPSWSNRWYFLPWDFNDGLGAVDALGQPPRDRTWVAPGNWWAVPLHKRYLKKAGNAAALTRRIESLARDHVGDAQVQAVLARVHDVIRQAVAQSPDVDHLPVTLGADTPAKALAEFEAEYARVGQFVSGALAGYQETVQWPMPMWLGSPTVMGNAMLFEWDASHDLQGDAITYDFRLARTPDLGAIGLIHEQLGLTKPEIAISPLTPGIYYYRVTARDAADPANHWQLPFDEWADPMSGRDYDGVKRFEVK